MKAPGDYQFGRGRDRVFPITFATIPATAKQRRTAVGVVIVLAIVATAIAPFADTRLPKVDAFVPVLQTVLAVADLITAILLFAQYVILPQRAILAIASAYVCSASFAFLQTLAFPGAYAPAGLIGDGFNSPAWFFVLWHATFPLGLMAYALLRDGHEPAIQPDRQQAETAIGLTLFCVSVVVAGLAWLVTAEVARLPAFYSDSVIRQTNLGNQINVVLLLWYSTALAALLTRRHTILDIWLIVILIAWMPNFLVAALSSSVRFSLGWYAARGFALVASFMLLSVLLTEMMVLYSRLANAFSLLSRERANRLVSIDAATAAIAHEVRSPLGAIALNADTALAQLQSDRPVLKDLRDVLKDIHADSLRANEVIASARSLFGTTPNKRTTAGLADVVRQALTLSEPDLLINEVSVTTEFRDDQAQVHADHVQLQQVILNLIRNAVEAMSTVAPNARLLTLTTHAGSGSSVLLSVHDTGTGILAGDRERIFDAFFTTKNSGMGLGLAISRTIVESHGGTLRLAASGSKGSTFEIILPKG